MQKGVYWILMVTLKTYVLHMLEKFVYCTDKYTYIYIRIWVSTYKSGYLLVNAGIFAKRSDQRQPQAIFNTGKSGNSVSTSPHRHWNDGYNKGKHPQMSLCQVSELCSLTQVYAYLYIYAYMHIPVYIYMCVYVCMYVCMYVRIYVMSCHVM